MSANLCLDFGTAYSKASAWTINTNRPIPLPLGRDTGDSGFIVPTTVLVANDGIVYFGEAARDKGRNSDLPVIDDLKRYLTRQRRALDRVLLPTRFNPTRFRLTIRHVIALYWGFLTCAAMKSLRERGDQCDVVQRTITMPVFSGDQHRHLKRELSFASDFGWHARDEFKDAVESGGVDLRTVVQRLRCLE